MVISYLERKKLPKTVSSGFRDDYPAITYTHLHGINLQQRKP